jgi:hypothetical protein
MSSSVTRHSFTSQGDGSPAAARVNRQGSAVVADQYLQWALEGRVFVANVGTETEAITFNAAHADAEPDLFIHVPSSTSIIPLYVSVGFEDTGTALALDVYAAVSATGDSAVSGTSITAVNARTDAPRSTACTVTSVVTSGGTDINTGNYAEFWRPLAGFGEDAFNGSTAPTNWRVAGVEWSAQMHLPVVVHKGGSLAVFAAAQAGIGFITVAWAEFTAADLA